MTESDFSWAKQYYTAPVQELQRKIETACDLLDYEGSRIYDEHPDSMMLEKMWCQIEQSEQADASSRCQGRKELIQVLFLQEISVRRCRNHRENDRISHGAPQ